MIGIGGTLPRCPGGINDSWNHLDWINSFFESNCKPDTAKSTKRSGGMTKEPSPGALYSAVVKIRGYNLYNFPSTIAATSPCTTQTPTVQLPPATATVLLGAQLDTTGQALHADC